MFWANRDNLGYAWKVVSKGVCDGCALGVAGLHDWTIDGVHLCMTRLNLLRLNTMPAARHPDLLVGLSQALASLRTRSCANSGGSRSRCCAKKATKAFGAFPGTRLTTGSPDAFAQQQPGADRVLPDFARDHERGLLHGAEGGAVPGHEQRG